MNGDPQDPIRFDMASRKLWERLVAREGVNLRQHQLSGVDATSREWRELDERLQHLRGDAQTMLLGYITVGPARWWTWDGERFRRPPPEALAMRFATTASDEPWSVYVDWSEIEAAIAIDRTDCPGVSVSFVESPREVRPSRKAWTTSTEWRVPR